MYLIRTAHVRISGHMRRLEHGLRLAYQHLVYRTRTRTRHLHHTLASNKPLQAQVATPRARESFIFRAFFFHPRIRCYTLPCNFLLYAD